MARIEDLISEIADEHLRVQVAREVAALKKQKKFGLVFEEHIPETVQISGLPIKRGLRVVKRGASNQGVYLVDDLLSAGRCRIRHENGKYAEETAKVKDLVVIKRFGEPIYPDTAQIVVSIYNRVVKTVRAFAWSDDKKDFVEVSLQRV